MLVMVLGLSYKTAPLALMERVVFSPEALPAALATLHEQGITASSCPPATAWRSTPSSGTRRAAGGRCCATWRTTMGCRSASWIRTSTWRGRKRPSATSFAWPVGWTRCFWARRRSSGQVRGAYQAAQRHGQPGPLLARLFRQAVEVGKRAHRETRIYQSAASVSAAAVGMARQSLGDLEARTALVVGAGETSRLTARTLQASGRASCW